MLRVVIAATAALLLAGPAAAQVESREGIALQNQILELRRDIDSLRAGGTGRLPPPVSSGGGTAASGDVLARLVERVGALEEQARSLRGRIDEIDNRGTQMRADLDKQRTDLEFRLDQLEGRGGARPPAVVPAPPAGQRPAANAPPAGQAPGQQAATPARPQGADATFTAAQAASRAGQHAEAERLFRDFARANGNDRRAPEAHHGIGASLLARREWAQAALAFDESYRRFPRGGFAQESLLGLGNSLSGLGDRTAACEAYGRLASEFATSMKPGIATSLGTARQRNNCR
jgi:TolA-binding protein